MSWWQSLYDEHLAEVLLTRESLEEVVRTSDFLERVLCLSPGMRVFDQCSGIGGVAIPLAERGLHVVGVEQCGAYVQRSVEEAAHVAERCSFFEGDAFEFVPERPVHAAYNWWTSFGYTRSDDKNSRMLARAFESLQPGGRFALDFLNLPGVLRGFQRHVVLRKPTPSGEVVLLRETALDLPSGTMEKTWTYFLPDGRRVTHQSSLRLYLPHQLRELLLGVGFEDVSFFGGVGGEALTMDTLRCIALARRPP